MRNPKTETTWEIRRPKTEIRKKPEIRIPKKVIGIEAALRASGFGFLSDFEFRISDFNFLRP
jgi:hypothetical protein